MRVGEHQVLQISRESPYGLYLTDGLAEVLLPENQCPEEAKVGDHLRVFLYTDSEDRLIATRMEPLVTAGKLAYLRVVDVNRAGAFFDWGLTKDLFCPFREQHLPLAVDDHALVFAYVDEKTNRIVGSTRITKFLSRDLSGLATGDKVEILVGETFGNFIRVIVNQQFAGAIFRDEWTEALSPGEVRAAYVKKIRDDEGVLALSLRPQGLAAILDLRESLLALLAEHGGELPISDKSSPEVIYEWTGLSKAAFKKLIGSLYKSGEILIASHAIRLSKKLNVKQTE